MINLILLPGPHGLNYGNTQQASYLNIQISYQISMTLQLYWSSLNMSCWSHIAYIDISLNLWCHKSYHVGFQTWTNFKHVQGVFNSNCGYEIPQ